MSFNLDSVSKQKTRLIALSLAIMVLAVYWHVQDFKFTNYDDQFYVVNNTNIKAGFTAKSIVYAFTDISTSNWHPLTLLSHMLDWSIFGKNSGGHHWTNVIIHILNAVLLFLFFKTATGALWRSAFVAALFAVHPINVESVAWIAERKNVLSTFFWIATLLFYIRYVASPGWKRYLPVLISFVLGLMSKPMVVTLPFALLLLDYWPLNRTRTNPQATTAIAAPIKEEKIAFLIWEKIPLFLLSAISCVVTFYAAKAGNAVASLQGITIGKRVTNIAVSYTTYIKKMFWPFDFSALYPFDYQIPIWQVILAAVFIVGVTVLICRYYRKFPYLPVGWFWYLGTLVPVIGIVHVGEQSMADRYAYIPFIGLFLILAWGLTDLLQKVMSRKFLAFASGGIIAACMMLAHAQLWSWENSYTLFQNAIKVSAKQHYVPYKCIALYYIDQKQPKEAAEYFQIAVSLKKNDPELHNSLGAALEMLGKEREAENQYGIALRLDPNHTLAHNNLGLLYMKQGRYDEALKHLREAVRLQPEIARAYFNMAESLKQKGLDREAAFYYEVAKKINPALGERISNK